MFYLFSILLSSLIRIDRKNSFQLRNTIHLRKKKKKGRKRHGTEQQKTVDLQDGNNLPLAQEAADYHIQFQKQHGFILKTRLRFSALAKLLINQCFHMTLDLLENFQVKRKLNHLSPAVAVRGVKRFRPNSYWNLLRAVTPGLQKSLHQNHRGFLWKPLSTWINLWLYIFKVSFWGSGKTQAITVFFWCKCSVKKKQSPSLYSSEHCFKNPPNQSKPQKVCSPN